MAGLDNVLGLSRPAVVIVWLWWLFTVFAAGGEGVVGALGCFLVACVVACFGYGFADCLEVGEGGVVGELEGFCLYVPHGRCYSFY